MRALHWALLIGTSLAFSLLFVAMNTPFIIAEGSDSLEIVIMPSALSQWATLLLYSCSYLFFIVYGRQSAPVQKSINILLILLFLALLILNSHFFKISGRESQLVDTWLFIPTQSMPFDPSGDMSLITYRVKAGAIDIQSDDNVSKMTVVTFSSFLGVRKNEMLTKLNAFGLSLK